MTPVHVFLLISLMSGTIFSATADGDTRDGEASSASDIIEAVNSNLATRRGGPTITDGDIAVSRLRNAAPCTARGCKWPNRWPWTKRIYIPVTIDDSFSDAERYTIIHSLVTFHRSTCIRFYWRSNDRDYLKFFSGSGCWSYVGYQGGEQEVSIQRRGCVYLGTIQHEVLHALGFHHEQARSDRDDHVTIVKKNILSGRERNFNKVATNNLDTPYDYNSVMHYSRYAFSKRPGVKATIVPKPDPDVSIGLATEMSENDIARVNKLYC